MAQEPAAPGREAARSGRLGPAGRRASLRSRVGACRGACRRDLAAGWGRVAAGGHGRAGPCGWVGCQFRRGARRSVRCLKPGRRPARARSSPQKSRSRPRRACGPSPNNPWRDVALAHARREAGGGLVRPEGPRLARPFGHERRCFCQRRHSRGGISHRRCNRAPAGASSRSARGESAANCTGVRVRGLLLTCAGADTRARCMRARLNEMLRAKCKRHSCPTPAAPDTVAWSLARAPRSAPALVIEAGSVRGPAAAAAAAAAELAPASVAALRECE